MVLKVLWREWEGEPHANLERGWHAKRAMVSSGGALNH